MTKLDSESLNARPSFSTVSVSPGTQAGQPVVPCLLSLAHSALAPLLHACPDHPGFSLTLKPLSCYCWEAPVSRPAPTPSQSLDTNIYLDTHPHQASSLFLTSSISLAFANHYIPTHLSIITEARRRRQKTSSLSHIIYRRWPLLSSDVSESKQLRLFGIWAPSFLNRSF